jgi:hypothetical protein
MPSSFARCPSKLVLFWIPFVFCSTTLQKEFASGEHIIESPHVHQSDSSDSVTSCVCRCLLEIVCVGAVMAICGLTVLNVVAVFVGVEDVFSDSELLARLLFPFEELSVK